jgi:hypothetical protein
METNDEQGRGITILTLGRPRPHRVCARAQLAWTMQIVEGRDVTLN